MEELSFSPNIFARSLQTNSIKLLGVMTIDISDIYFAAAIQAIERYASASGYDVQVSFARNDRDDKIKRLKTLIEKRVDGIILVGSAFMETDNSHIIETAKTTPVVILNGDIQGEGVYSVLCEDDQGIRAAVEHLVAAGKRNIAYVYDTQNLAAKSKLKGYKQSMKNNGLKPHILKTDSGPEGGYDACKKLFKRYGELDGIVCAEDALAVGVMKRLREMGLHVPNDVAVTGYDNLIIAKCSVPELTSVDGKVESMSITATKTLIDVLEGKSVPKKTIITPELVIRAST